MRDRKADVDAGIRSATRACQPVTNGWDKPSAYLAGYLAGVRAQRRKARKPMLCPKHPRYKAVLPPRCACTTCHRAYRERNW